VKKVFTQNGEISLLLITKRPEYIKTFINFIFFRPLKNRKDWEKSEKKITDQKKITDLLEVEIIEEVFINRSLQVENLKKLEETQTEPEINMEPNSFWTNLNYKEVAKLQKILDSKHHIHGKGNFPTIEVEPRTLIQVYYLF